MTQSDQLCFPILADLQARGDGTFVLRPRVMGSDLDTWISPKQVRDILSIRTTRSVYYLLDESEPYLVSYRPLPRKIVISLKSVQDYKRAAADPAFWSQETPALRNAHIARVRSSISALSADPAAPAQPVQPTCKPFAKQTKP